MSSLASLRSVKFVLLLPESVRGDLNGPVFAKVMRRSKNGVSVRSTCENTAQKWTISAADAEAWAVREDEVEAYGHVSPLRSSVAALSNGVFIHGQVIRCGEDGAVVRSSAGDKLVRPEALILTSPVVALLLRDTSFDASEWSQDEVVGVQQQLLDRVLGNETTGGSSDLDIILDDLLEKEDRPSPSIIVEWINPKSGELRRFELQHAVDYAHFIDGQGANPNGQLGRSFCSPPARLRRAKAAKRHVARVESDSVSHLFNALEDGDLNLDEAPELGAPAAAAAASHEPPAASSAKGQRTLSGGRSDDAAILQALSAHPDLQRVFAERYVLPIRGASANDGQETCVPQHTPGLYDSRYGASKVSRGTFEPTGPQQWIHQRITAQQHLGKPPAVFVDELIDAASVLFKPLPGVLMRIYDIQFGNHGLSIMHFRRLALVEKVEWLAEGAANLQHFSAAVEAPQPQRPRIVQDVVNSIQTLAIFSAEYFSVDLHGVIAAIVAVIQQVAESYRWDAQDLPLLVFWVNSTLAQYRSLADNSGVVPGQFVGTVSIMNGNLQNILQVVSVRRLGRVEGSLLPGPALHVRPVAGVKVEPKASSLPKELSVLVPIKAGKELCLRYLSVKGCSMSGTDECYSRRAHFEPETLHSRLKALIRRKFGGLKPKYTNL